MKHTLGALLIFGLVAGLSACGGGGGSKPQPNEIPSSSAVSSVISSSLPSSVSSAVSNSSVTSSLQVSSMSSSSIAAAKASALVSGSVYLKDIDDGAITLDAATSVTITLSLLNSDGNIIATNSPKLIDTGSSLPEQGTPFTAELTGSDAKTIVAIISKPGFSDYARRIEFSPDVKLTATLRKLQELKIDSTQATLISGKVVDGFNVSVNNSNGNQEIINGNAGAISDLIVSIPQSALPSGTSSLDVKMQAFNPNNLDEAESFPGAYQDSTGNKLLSVAFNYTDVKTDSGVSLQKIAQETRKSRLLAQKQSGTTISPLQFAKQTAQKTGVASDPVIINRKIPEESCLSLSQLGDANATLAGFQVPVYTYNPDSGLWDLLGYGTLFDEDGKLVAEDNKIFNCSLYTYVLEIEATNEIFLRNWWNLDYPLVFQQPVTLCANIELRNEGNKPLAGSFLYFSDDDEMRSFSSETFVTDENGRVHIEVISLDNGVDLTATANIYGASLYSGYATAEVKLSTSCSIDTPRIVVPVAVPEMCKADGRAIDANGAVLTKHFIVAGDFTDFADARIPAFAITDATGHYSLELACRQKYDVLDLFSAWSVLTDLPNKISLNVNGVVEASEVSDNGSAVVSKDLVVTTSKPLATVYNTENSLTKISLSVLYFGNDFPLTYSFSLKDSTGAVAGQYSGNLTSIDFNTDTEEYGFRSAEIQFDHKLPAQMETKIYTVDGEMKDSKGVTSVIFGSVFQGNLSQ